MFYKQGKVTRSVIAKARDTARSDGEDACTVVGVVAFGCVLGSSRGRRCEMREVR